MKNAKQIFRNVLFLFVLVAVIAVGASARVIQTPVLTAPAFVAPGGAIEVTVSLEQPGALDKMLLRNSLDKEQRFEIELGEQAPAGEYTFTAPLPAEAAPAMYDLCLAVSRDGDTGKECQPHAVAVVEPEKKSFRFAIFTDYHVGDPRALNNNPGMGLDKLREMGFEALNSEHPDFVLMPGDLTSYPSTYPMDYRDCYKELRSLAQAPLVAVPGNHDLYSVIQSMTEPIDGRDFWQDFFGPLHYAFTYGDFRFIGYNSYGWAGEYRDRNLPGNLKYAGSSSAGTLAMDEYEWLKKEFDYANEQGLTPIVFAHHGTDIMSSFRGDNGEYMNGEDTAAFFNENGVKYYFVGHTHESYMLPVGDMALVSTGTVASSTNNQDGWCFRIIDVSEDGEFSMRVVKFHMPGAP